MRLFAAVPLPETGRSECAKVLAEARASGWPVRWVKDDLAHITLKFFGEVAPERLVVIAEAVQGAASGAEPMSLRLQSLGAFPTFRRRSREDLSKGIRCVQRVRRESASAGHGVVP